MQVQSTPCHRFHLQPHNRSSACLRVLILYLTGDRAVPACSNCAKSKVPRACTYDSLKLRHSKYSTTRHGRSNIEGQVSLHTASPSKSLAALGVSLMFLISRLCVSRLRLKRCPEDLLGPWPPDDFIDEVQRAPDPGTNVDSSSNHALGSESYENHASETTGNSPSAFFGHRLPPRGHLLPPTVGPSSHTQEFDESDTERALFEFYKSYAGVLVSIEHNYSLRLLEDLNQFLIIKHSLTLLLRNVISVKLFRDKH